MGKIQQVDQNMKRCRGAIDGVINHGRLQRIVSLHRLVVVLSELIVGAGVLDTA